MDFIGIRGIKKRFTYKCTSNLTDIFLIVHVNEQFQTWTANFAGVSLGIAQNFSML